MSCPVLLRVQNASTGNVELVWVPEGRDAEIAYATLRPREVYTQQTYVGHSWRFRGLHLSTGLSAPQADSTVIVNDGGISISHTLIPMHALHGCLVRATIHGAITITAVEAVRDEAVLACVECVSSMIDGMPEKDAILKSMAAIGVEIAIIGVGQKTTDVPAHAHLKGEAVVVGPARTFDDGTRGLGATVACPVMSVGEENLLPDALVDEKYPDESILVHEFAHTVMNLGLKDTRWYGEIKHAYCAARRSNAYDLKSYCMENAEEYWAEMTQAWFGATRRQDVTSGITSRRQLMERDPRLAAVMLGVYGDCQIQWTWRPSDGGAGRRRRGHGDERKSLKARSKRCALM